MIPGPPAIRGAPDSGGSCSGGSRVEDGTHRPLPLTPYHMAHVPRLIAPSRRRAGCHASWRQPEACDRWSRSRIDSKTCFALRDEAWHPRASVTAPWPPRVPIPAVPASRASRYPGPPDSGGSRVEDDAARPRPPAHGACRPSAPSWRMVSASPRLRAFCCPFYDVRPIEPGISPRRTTPAVRGRSLALPRPATPDNTQERPSPP